MTDIDAVRALAGGTSGPLSVGGMSSKLAAVELAVAAGIDAVIANGRRDDAVASALSGDPYGTLFPARRPEPILSAKPSRTAASEVSG